MTLADLIQQPVSYETAKELAIILTADQAAQLAAIQAEYGDPRHVASPVDLVDGRKMLCADLLTEVGPGGMYATGFGFLPTELFPQVAVLPMAEVLPLLPQPEEEIA
jgi:hypothetical protein